MLLDAVMQGITASGNSADRINLPELDIHPCIGCGNCEKEGQCVFKDDMREIYTKIENADRIIIGTPIYFYNVTAQTKGFIDRCQTLWSRKYILGEINLRREQRKGYLVSVAATSGGRIFEGASLTCRYAFDAMDFTYAGDLLFPGIDKKGRIADNPDNLNQAVQFGIQITQP